jgi:HK97 gp10 family phage protein
MKKFDSLGAFGEHLAQRAAATVTVLHEGLEAVARHVEKKAVEKIGEYQEEVGPFPAWTPLAPATIDDRIAKGFSPDEPLLRTGEMRDSIKHEVDGLEAIIGSQSPIAAYQEFGTEKIPPRPFIGPAAFESKKQIEAILGIAIVTAIAGGNFTNKTTLED